MLLNWNYVAFANILSSPVFPDNYLNVSFPLLTCGNSFLSKVAILHK